VPGAATDGPGRKSRPDWADGSRFSPMLDKNVAIGVRAAVADHLGRAPTRAELTAARRAAHSLAALGRARVLHVSGADADANASDRSYLVLAKPNVIMKDTRLRGLAVAGSDAAGRKGPQQLRPGRSQPGTLAPERSRWCPTNPSRRVGQRIGCRRRGILADALVELRRLERRLDRRIR
jgi:hypothetical protein